MAKRINWERKERGNKWEKEIIKKKWEDTASVGGRMRQRLGVKEVNKREKDGEREREREIIEGKKMCEQSKQYKEVYTWVT